MAIKQIGGNGNTDLGDSGDGSVTTKVLQFTGTGWNVAGTIQLTARRKGSSAAFVPIPYRRRYLNGAVSDDQYGSAGITADSLIEVNATGVELRLVTTGWVAGTMAVDFGDYAG